MKFSMNDKRVRLSKHRSPIGLRRQLATVEELYSLDSPLDNDYCFDWDWVDEEVVGLEYFHPSKIQLNLIAEKEFVAAEAASVELRRYTPIR